MNLKEELPPFHEFHDQINLNFDQRDIDFQKSMAEKAGFLSWMNYLQIIHYLISNVLDIKAFANDLLTESSQANNSLKQNPFYLF